MFACSCNVWLFIFIEFDGDFLIELIGALVFGKPHWPTNDQLVVLISTQEGQCFFLSIKNLYISQWNPDLQKGFPNLKKDPFVDFAQNNGCDVQISRKKNPPKSPLNSRTSDSTFKIPRVDRSWWGRPINPATWSDISRILRHNSLTNPVMKF